MAGSPEGLRDQRSYALHTAARACDLQRVRELIDKQQMNPDGLDAEGLTPLEVAYDCAHVYWQPPDPRAAQVVEYLLSKGADPNRPFRYGDEPRYTVLHRAAYDGNMVLVPMLVAAGARVNARDSRDFTPLHAAARCDFRLSCDDCSGGARDDFAVRWKQGARPVIRYLLEHGADITARTVANQSVLDIFTTPCQSRPELCAPEQLASAEWPTGTCKQSYLFVKEALDQAQRFGATTSGK